MIATLEETEKAALPKLSNEEIARYSRHLILPEVGMEGQQKLKAAKVLCVGTGGLGAPLALYLTAAGVGTIGLVDFDVVDESNLQRQIIHSQSTVGKLKVDSAEIMLKGLNKNVNVIKHNTMLTSANALEIFKDYDVIADGTDNFQTRYLVNAACVLTGKPNAYGSIFRFEGQASVFATEEGPCYRCLYPEPPPPGLVPSCAEGGVLGILPGLVGVIQATEVIKLILGIGRPAIGRLTTFSALDLEFRAFKIRRDPQCPVCGEHPTITKPIDYEEFCGVPILDPQSVAETQAEVRSAKSGGNGRPATDPSFDSRGLPPGYAFKPDWEITPRDVKSLLDQKKDFLFIDCRLPNEYALTHIDGAKLIPLQEIAKRIGELKGHEAEKIVVHCKSGGRSMQFTQILRQQGFKDVKSMAGGILLWNKDINPGGPQY